MRTMLKMLTNLMLTSLFTWSANEPLHLYSDWGMGGNALM